MGKKIIEIRTCDFCPKEIDYTPETLSLSLGRDLGDFDLCDECANMFREKFFGLQPDTEGVIGDPEAEYEDEEDDPVAEDEDGFDDPIGESEDEYDFEDFEDEEDEEEEPAPPPPKKKLGRPRKKVAKKKTTGRKKKVNKQRYSDDPLAGIDHKEKDGTVIGRDGSVRAGKVLQKIEKAAASERRGVIKRCPNGECEYDEDTGRCDACGLKRGQTGMEEGAQKAHDPIQANAEGQGDMGYDPYMQAHTFPVDVNSDQVQKRMKKNLRKQNEAVRKKFSKSGRYFNFDPTDGVGRGR